VKKIELSTLQKLQLSVLKEVDRICKKHGIKYYLIGGTLIGAIRHKGFIPWDDDIDIAMMRLDYDRFIKCSEEELNSKYFIQNYNTDIDFYHALTRICIKGTFVEDKHTKHLKCHKETYIDIFPLDNVPDDEEELKKQKRKILLVDKILKYKACILHENGVLYSKFLIKKFLSVILKPISQRTLYNYRQKYMKKYFGQNTLRVSSTASKYGFSKQIMLKSIYGDPTMVEFEGGMYPAPQDWEYYLNHLYGNYMSLPPKDARMPTSEVYQI